MERKRHMLEIKQVSKRFWRKQALQGVDMKLEKGIYGLLGDNGAGKTTLLRCIAGLYKPNEGEICWNQENVLKSKSYQEILGYLPQRFEGLKELKVREFLEYFGDLKGMTKEQLRENVEEVLDAVHLVDKKEDKVRTLSGGMQRRLGIAQAMLNHPKLLILDAPTAGLDPKERLRFQNVLSTFQNTERIVLLSTHIVSDIETLCDHIIVMKQGNVLGIYTPEELAAEAKGRVYELTEDQYRGQMENCQMIRRVQKEGKTFIRVLSGEKLDAQETEPMIEDGYLWITTEV